jgi:signal peptidase I
MWEWIRSSESTELIFYGLFAALILGEVVLRFLIRVAKGNVILEYVDSGFIAILLALVIRTLAVQSFKIPSESMRETLQIGDYLLVNKYIYGTYIPFTEKMLWRLREPKHGDVIVFKYPKNPRRSFIKRCIGLPGDVVEVKNKIV